MPRRYAAKVDTNQREIVNALRRIGAQVQPLHTIGKGCPDILVAHRGQWYVAEIKDGEKTKSKQVLTHDESEWHERFGQVAIVHVWASIEDALRALGVTV